MVTADTRPRIVMRGAVGLSLDILDAEKIDHYKRRLTVSSIPYRDQAPIVVQAYEESDGYLWLPRYFDRHQFWPLINNWEWVSPHLDYRFEQRMEPDPSRGQPEAIDALVKDLRDNSATIGVLPTGQGKTMVAYTIASKFQTPIAVFVYAGHMIDNWIEHAESVLGVPKSDIGLVKEGRCDLGKPITIVSIQTALVRDLPEALYKQIGFIASDEVQHFGAKVWGQVISKFPARFRLGISADPVRDDGLDPVIRWNFGKVGYASYKSTAKDRPLVCLVRFPSTYPERSYCDVKNVHGHWVKGYPNAMKYSKKLLHDKARNEWLVQKIIEARLKGRRILVFATLRDHVEILHSAFNLQWASTVSSLKGSPVDGDLYLGQTKSALLWGGVKEQERATSMRADVIFTTHSYSREALNVTHIDTLFFATPPGDPLQPVGRLRDRGPEDRKSLLVFDVFENTDYSFRRAMDRKRAYEDLGLEVRRVARK